MMKLFLFLISLITLFIQASTTALDDYVWKPDSNYGWVDLGPNFQLKGKSIHGGSWTGYTLNMTSQRWLTDADFAPNSQTGSLWWHFLVVIVPDEIQWDRNATLYITGGSNDPNSAPTTNDEDIKVAASLAMANKIVTGAFFQIPNEHTIFAADPIQKSRSEDAIIAYTWDHFLKDPSQPEWLLRFPMVKASLRAMDAITEFMQKTFPEKNTQLDYYTVAGASKRGWTTWDVGAVDTGRVKAIVPIVLDAINFVEVMHHQFRSYGNWSFALQDYIDMNILTRIDDPNMLLLQQQVDPFFYKERLTMPKLVVNAVLDEFQQPDDTHYWWSEMPSPKHFIMTPNAEHSEATGIFEIVPAISSWIKHLLDQTAVPEFTWEISPDTGAITVTLNEHGIVHEANVWWAYSCGNNQDGKMRRDFRCAMLDAPCKCGIAYEGTCANLKSLWSKKALDETTVRGKRTYTAQVDAPGDGRWVAFMIEITYADTNKRVLINTQDNLGGKIADKIGDKIGKIVDKIEDAIPPLPHDLIGRLVFTSEVSVWPNTFPYADCKGVTCGESTC